jgi:cell division inhibitor SepF
MAGALHKTMLYLGLAEDEQDVVEEYLDDVEDDDDDDRGAEVTPLRRTAPRAVPAAGLRRISTIHPRSYNDVRAIGEAFRAGTPVIMNLSEMTDADAKRLVDFSAGLIFGLRGAIERVTSKVFLLSPEHVEISGEDSPVGEEQASFYNQS